MPHSLSHKDLLDNYLQLQERATRFQVTEQKLIYAKDQLDQELEVYKKMHEFHSRLIQIKEVWAFAELTAEEVINIFETEVGFCQITTKSGEKHRAIEGVSKSRQKEVLAILDGLESCSGQIIEVETPNYSFDRMLVGCQFDPDHKFEIKIVMAVTGAKRQIYPLFDAKVKSLFSIFQDKVVSLVKNLLSMNQINNQLQQISTSQNELRLINERFDLVTKNTSVGIWEYDIENKTMILNDVLKETFEIEKNNLTPRSMVTFWRSIIDPEFKDVLNVIDSQAISGKPQKVTIEYKSLVPNVGPRYFQSSSFIEYKEGRRKLLGITIDITSRKENEERLLESNKELLKANNELDQFVYSVSHDLRAPLLSIRGVLQLMEPEITKPMNQKFVSLIHTSINRLDESVLEILDYSRNSRLDEIKTQFDIAATVHEIFQDLAHVTESIKLSSLVLGKSLIVHDEHRIKILLKNIISNSVKYSRQGVESFVNVEIQSDDDGCQITVSDNGEGVPDKHKEKIFRMFYRASGSSTGTGLGLYICKEIVDKLKGTIQLDSVFGEGTKVTVTLPSS